MLRQLFYGQPPNHPFFYRETPMGPPGSLFDYLKRWGSAR